MSTYDVTPFFNQPPHAFFHGLVASEAGIGDEVVQIGDRFYLLDLLSDRYRIATIQAQRPQSDESDRPGESTLSSEGLWRRHISSWHRGAGQLWYDRDDADPFRYNTSRGIDPFERWKLTLLHTTEIIDTNSGGWTSMAVGDFGGESRVVVAGASGRCITIDDQGNQTEVSGLSGTVWVASTGAQVYVSDSTGIHPLNAAGTGKGTSFNTNITGAKLWFAKDRLWAAVGNALYNVIDGTTSTAHFTQPWPSWQWTSVHEGGEYVYATGFSGDKGRVYSIGIDSDGTNVLPPLVALPLPDGEVPHVIHGYVGLVAVGTNLGLRMAQADGPHLISGPIVGYDRHAQHEHPVRCIEGQDNFLWFGQDNIFTDASGLGRVDLRTFVETLAPAYATDLMGAATGLVTAVITFDDRRWFAVANSLYRETDDTLASGTLETGRVTMNITDHKVFIYSDIRHDGLPTGGSVSVAGSIVEGVFEHHGTSAVPTSERPIDPFTMNHHRAVWHEIRATLAQTGGESPILTAISTAAQPVPDRSESMILPILLHEVINYADQEFALDVREEFQHLRALARSQQLIRFRHGSLTALAFVEDYEWAPHQPQQDGRFFNGTMYVKLKTAEVER